MRGQTEQKGNNMSGDAVAAMVDKLEIIDVMSRYCFAVDFREMQQLRTVFA